MSSLFTISCAYSPARPTSMQCQTYSVAPIYPLFHVRATGRTIPCAQQPDSPGECVPRDPATLQEATPCPARHTAQRTEPATTQCQTHKPGQLPVPLLTQIKFVTDGKASPPRSHLQHRIIPSPPHPTPSPTQTCHTRPQHHQIPAHTPPATPSSLRTQDIPRNPLTHNTMHACPSIKKGHSPS